MTATLRSARETGGGLAILVALTTLLLPLASAGNEHARESGFADATGFHTQKKMARGADGALWYTYVVPSGVGNETDVVVVHEGQELPRVRGARGDLARPSLVLDASGDAHLAWTERADEDREVFAARYHAGNWTDVVQLSGGEGYAGFPSLAAGLDGRVHVAWYGFDGAFYQTFYREWNGSWLPARQLSAGPLDANNPSVVVGPDGAVHVAWYKDEGRRFSVWHARRAPSGDWDVPARIPGTRGDALNVALAFDPSGALHAVWDERAPEGLAVMHATWTQGRWREPVVLASGPDAGEYPAIAARGQGVLVVWAREDGVLVGSDATATPAPVLEGVKGRHPSLRGPSIGDPSAIVELLWAEPQGDGFAIRHAVLDAAAVSPVAGPSAPLLWLLVACCALVLQRSGQRD